MAIIMATASATAVLALPDLPHQLYGNGGAEHRHRCGWQCDYLGADQRGHHRGCELVSELKSLILREKIRVSVDLVV